MCKLTRCAAVEEIAEKLPFLDDGHLDLIEEIIARHAAVPSAGPAPASAERQEPGE